MKCERKDSYIYHRFSHHEEERLQMHWKSLAHKFVVDGMLGTLTASIRDDYHK
jgi:hypothetical protein